MDIDKTAECMVAGSEGSLRRLESEIPLSIIASVTTSLIARKQSLASRMTAALIAEAAQTGSELSALGMFERATTLDWDLELPLRTSRTVRAFPTCRPHQSKNTPAIDL